MQIYHLTRITRGPIEQDSSLFNIMDYGCWEVDIDPTDSGDYWFHYFRKQDREFYYGDLLHSYQDDHGTFYLKFEFAYMIAHPIRFNDEACQ